MITVTHTVNTKGNFDIILYIQYDHGGNPEGFMGLLCVVVTIFSNSIVISKLKVFFLNHENDRL